MIYEKAGIKNKAKNVQLTIEVKNENKLLSSFDLFIMLSISGITLAEMCMITDIVKYYVVICSHKRKPIVDMFPTTSVDIFPSSGIGKIRTKISF